MRRAAALALLAACWTGDPPPPAAPAPAAPHALHAKRHVTHPRRTADVQPDVVLLAGLSDRLRNSGATELPVLVWGPIVVLDMDTGAITTLCGAAADRAARDWGAAFADPAQRAGRCTVTTHLGTDFVCMQFSPGPTVLTLAFDDPQAPHLVGAVSGSLNNVRNLARYTPQLQTTLANPACTPQLP